MTARILTGLCAVLLGLPAALSLAQSMPNDQASSYDRVGAGQTAGPRFEDKRQRADDLLQRAYQLMDRGELDQAGQLIGQAEAINPEYPAFYGGTTPAKARSELERRFRASGRGAPRTGLLGFGGSRAAGAPTDPFAASRAGEAGAMGDPKTAAKQYIRQARQALERGNMADAEYFQRKAAEQPAVFGDQEDSPERLAADLRRMGGPADSMPAGGGPGSRGVTPLPRIDQATMLPPPAARHPGAYSSAPSRGDQAPAPETLLQARRALAVGDTRRAGSLVERARSLGGPYDPVDNPDKVQYTISRYSDLMAQRAERGNTETWRREHARILMEQADVLMRYRDYDEAERLAMEAQRQGVRFSQFEPRPEQILQHIADLRRSERGPARGPSGVMAADYTPGAGPGADANRGPGVSRAVYDPASDPTQNMPAASDQAMPAGAPPEAAGSPGLGATLFAQGQAALRAGNREAALDLFREAYAHVNELDPATARRLHDYLLNLPPTIAPARRPGGPADDAQAKQQMLFRQIASEVAQQESNARRILETDPKGALTALEQTKAKVEQSELEKTQKDPILRRLDRALADTRKFIADHRPQIDLDERNRATRQEIQREQQSRQEIETKFAQKVDEFRTLVHEQRFAEAEVVAKQAEQLKPNDPVSTLLVEESKLMRRVAENRDLKERKEQGFLDALKGVDESSVPWDDAKSIVFPDSKTWKGLSDRRLRLAKEMGRRGGEKEVEIRQKLKTPVSLQFENAPLSQVLAYMSKIAGINIYPDPQGLAEEGVTTDTPVTINLPQEVKLESALNLILHPLRLGYVVKDEVLKITSEQHKAGDLFTKTYNVADLVIGIPNFAPGTMGLENAIAQGFGRNAGMVGGNPALGVSANAPVAHVATRDGRAATGVIDPNILAQMQKAAGPSPTSVPAAPGQGAAGGAAFADFDSLIQLITSTIQPTTWDEVGGPGSIKEFPTNLSLVVSQTQDVHEEIVDLLEQLRRMQDLQVTIEVRFITLNDNFFERIGVSFDFQINDRVDHPDQGFGRILNFNTGQRNTNVPFRDMGAPDASMTVGLSGAPNQFSADLDIPFTQNSYAVAVPQFGGFDPQSAATLGFAILSDIEAYFFVMAAQGDRRSNVLQAPKVTLFNGQQAFVSDTSQSPFVISVIPVVGEFAAAQQPVIVVLNEGTFLTVQAVVSSDRRFVRLTIVPFFSQIQKVSTFTFQGSQTTNTDNSTEGVQDKPNDSTKKTKVTQQTNSGTTVQLPTFSFVTVTTTVSVPDGGTVLLGGIKRLSEGRNEFGVPILNKIPYLNRLFKNVGIGRETQSLMMMVTPRIIIQEEEEERLGITTTP